MSWNKELIQKIKDCGQSLIDNAENIVNYKYIRGLTITCYVDDRTEPPNINVDIDFYPEKFFERY